MSKTPEQITEALIASFPHELIEDKQGKRYIAAEQIIWRLIEATDNTYEFRIDQHEYRNDGALKDRKDRDGNTIPAPPVCVVHGTLTIPGLGSRGDSGVQEIEAGQGADAAYKGAVSDCIKRCARLFGVGLRQLYMGEDVPTHLMDGKERAAARSQPSASTRPANGHAANTTGQATTAAPRAPQAQGSAREAGAAGATDKQMGFIERLAKERNIPMQELEAEAVRRFKVARISGMSIGDAKGLIDWLKKQAKRDINGTEPGVHSAPAPAVNGTEAKKHAWKAKAEAAMESPEALEKLCDEADSPGKWVMLAQVAPDMAALDAIGMAAVDRGSFDAYLETAVARRKAELGAR